MMEHIYANDVCIVIPIYKDNVINKLTKDEIESINNTLSLMHNYDIYFLCNNTLNTIYYRKLKSKYQRNIYFKHFDFNNIFEYSDMCLNHKFYEMFNKYKYMLICQPDAWIFKDELLYWCNKGYNYIGALILFKEFYNVYVSNIIENVYDFKICMNGGFSLRKIKSLYDICYKYDLLSSNISEDLTLCLECGTELNLPIPEEAIKFSAETITYAFYPKYYDKLPFGCHTVGAKKDLYKIFNLN